MAAAAVAAGVLAGCLSAGSSALRDAARLAETFPFVEFARYSAPSMMDEELLEVVIHGWTQPGDGIMLWCEIIIPRGGSDSNVSVESRDGTVSIPAPASCP